MTDPFDGLPKVEYTPDPFRERVLLTLANADLQMWPDINHNTDRHMAEMMYGQQADAVINLINELLDNGKD